MGICKRYVGGWHAGFVPGLFHLDMSIPLLPLIYKSQVLEVGHTTDTRRRITLLSSTLKVAKVSNTVDFTSLRMSVSVKRKRVERYRSAY